MPDSLFSTYWYRVAKLKPALRDSTVVSRHVYRGEPWYVLFNRLNGRSHRFNASAYALIAQMNGQTSVQQIWDTAGASSSDEAPTQDELIRLLGQLHDADLIQSDILPSTVELIHQAQTPSGTKWKQRVSNPFSLRFPLWDPDRFLEKWHFLVGPLFTRGALVVWFGIVLAAVVAAGMHRAELSANLADRLFSPTNLLLLWLVYPFVKILHEFGHALAVKRWGGDVHEMGIMLLALTPIPFVDASASAAFPDKRHRIAVASMGMMVELLLAALAVFVWLHVQTGLISALAFNVMLIGGISTVLFNGNPLLRYDGYYMLADLIEIPNLSQRSGRYFGYLVQRYLLRIPTAESPVTAAGEKGWFLVYGPISFCYRIVVLVGLVWLVSSRFFVIGVLIALWGAFSLLIVPALRTLYRFITSPAARRRRARVIVITGGASAALLALLVAFPMPLWTTTHGVIQLPEQAVIRAGADIEVVDILAPVEQRVAKGQPLLKGVDPFLAAQIEVYQAQLNESYARYNALPLHERVKRKVLLEEIQRVKGDLQQAQEKSDKLVVRSPAQGRFVLTDPHHLPGRFVNQGDVVGYIFSDQRPMIRAVVTQSNIGLVRERLSRIQIRLTERLDRCLTTRVERIVPAADLNLPSAALGTAGGGVVPVDPSDPNGLRALESLFQLDLRLPEELADPHIGARVYVRFDHGRMPLAMQWYRSLRQLFLKKFFV